MKLIAYQFKCKKCGRLNSLGIKETNYIGVGNLTATCTTCKTEKMYSKFEIEKAYDPTSYKMEFDHFKKR